MTYFDKVMESARKHGFYPAHCKGMGLTTPVAFANAGHCLSRHDGAPVVFVIYNDARLAPLEHAESIKEVIVLRRTLCEGDDCFDTPCVRICGERDDPHGAGSESLPLQDVDSPAEIASALTVLVLNRTSRYGPRSGWTLWECPECLIYKDKPVTAKEVVTAIERLRDTEWPRNSSDCRQ